MGKPGAKANHILAPHQYTSISFPAKVLKLVLNEIQAEGEFGNLTAHDTADIDSDDGVS
jgi:hypothetical protein